MSGSASRMVPEPDTIIAEAETQPNARFVDLSGKLNMVD
jgi:hypothetical protein